jgi:methyltransferase
MEGISFFAVFYFILVIQRIVELKIAKLNENWMLQRGALEFGKNHYHYMVFMHVLFFAALLAEKIIADKGISTFWPLLLIVFFLLQGLRVWAILSLGRYWNTKILVVPNAYIVKKGPYHFIKHPNYLVVSLELLVIPVLFNAYFTAAIFTLLNMAMLSVRIPQEECALKSLTEYEACFQNYNRFFPKFLHKYDN